MSGKKKKRNYFPNNWQEYYEADPEMFLTHTFEEIVEWKLRGWELPSSITCIIRTTDLATKKVKEHVYRRKYAADNKIVQLLNNKTHEFTVVTHDAQHFFGPSRYETDE
jgi:HD-like signal output (HDOD) protein|tara:strand:- start:870 stop:1196 length:327 start_codon:yes stop_codon:yes gene_type:complete